MKGCEEEEEEKRQARLDKIPCHVSVWILTDHRVRKKEEDGETET